MQHAGTSSSRTSSRTTRSAKKLEQASSAAGVGTLSTSPSFKVMHSTVLRPLYDGRSVPSLCGPNFQSEDLDASRAIARSSMLGMARLNPTLLSDCYKPIKNQVSLHIYAVQKRGGGLR